MPLRSAPILRALGLILFFLGFNPSAPALTPMWSYISLVAGEGDSGFRDGPFDSALFNHPNAIVSNTQGTLLYVADRDNHCVRVIDLEKNNQVSTLAGTEKKGQSNGGFKSASFNLPSLLAFIPENRLILYDAETRQLRLLDLAAEQVTTLLSLPASKKPESNDAVYSLAYLPGDQSLYFSQPDVGKLTRLNLVSKTVKVFRLDSRLSRPGALTVLGGKLYIANTDLPSVYRVDAVSDDSDGKLEAALTQVGQGENIVCLASDRDKLYAVQTTGDPWVQIAPHPGPVKIMTQAGGFLEKGGAGLGHLFNFSSPLGLLADPGQRGNFYLALPSLNAVISLKDYEFDQHKESESENDNGLMDFTYPDAKPPGVFRLLEIGDSRMFFETEESKDKTWPWGYNRMVTNPKKMELFLNTWATLNSEDTHYQVLFSGARRVYPIHLRSYYAAPQLAQKFDADLVLICMPMDFNIRSYQDFPYGQEGIPLMKIDTEFLQKPLSTRLKEDRDPILADLYQRCLDRRLIKPGQEVDLDLPPLVSDDKTREDLLALAANPLKLLAGKIKELKTKDGRPVGLGLVFFPVGNTGGDNILPTEMYRNFWLEACGKAGVSFYDLTAVVASTRISYYPISEFTSYRHFNDYGHDYFSIVMAQMLMKEKLIPLGTPSESGKK